MQQHYDYATHQGRRFGRSAGRWATRIPDSVRRLIAGGVAGGVSKTVTAPIETVRLSSMAGRGTITEIAQRIWLKHGLLGFFSGNAADVIRVMPSKAIELAAFDAFKAILMKKNPKTGRQNGNGAFLTGVAGGAAGVTATIAMFPLETVRTRLAMNNGEYGSILHAMSTILREEGFGAFYRGLDASLIGVIPYAALRLGLYDGFKWSYRKVTGEQTVPASHAMVFGALAGLLSATATFPLEVVRRRMMLGTAKGNTFKAVAAIAAAEGWGSLYKGLALTWAKQVPQNAITFVAYDLSKQWLELQA
ncbi:hypothetical protein WJX72_010326 [[Myrmecia] bisecta]|uniref:Mitochondrial carrier protein n=1 Tax=[Myrmecia] bisecta TaxID=41462 RepID=A0AAW1Q310_9CHLO